MDPTGEEYKKAGQRHRKAISKSRAALLEAKVDDQLLIVRGGNTKYPEHSTSQPSKRCFCNKRRGADFRREALTKCLERLAPRALEIVDLRCAEQSLSPPEIAERLAWTTNAVHVALSRARAFLRECTQQVLASGEAS